MNKVDEYVKGLNEGVTDDIKAGYEKAKTVGKHAAVGLIAGAAIGLAVKLYKRYATEAGKLCGELHGSDKRQCVAKVKITALNRSKKALLQGKAKCATSRNPTKCADKLNVKIKAVEKKIEDLRAAMTEY